jgi:hypothetical protein
VGSSNLGNIWQQQSERSSRDRNRFKSCKQSQPVVIQPHHGQTDV